MEHFKSRILVSFLISCSLLTSRISVTFNLEPLTWQEFYAHSQFKLLAAAGLSWSPGLLFFYDIVSFSSYQPKCQFALI